MIPHPKPFIACERVVAALVKLLGVHYRELKMNDDVLAFLAPDAALPASDGASDLAATQSRDRLFVFRPGKFTSMQGEVLTFTLDDLEEIRACYDPAIYRAPLVLGHPAHDAPAWGWVRGLDVTERGLFASLEDISPRLRERVRAGEYRHLSCAFFPRGASSNPFPGKLYLRHIGLLGAVAPAVSGLGEVSLAAPFPDDDPARSGKLLSFGLSAVQPVPDSGGQTGETRLRLCGNAGKPFFPDDLSFEAATRLALCFRYDDGPEGQAGPAGPEIEIGSVRSVQPGSEACEITLEQGLSGSVLNGFAACTPKQAEFSFSRSGETVRILEKITLTL